MGVIIEIIGFFIAVIGVLIYLNPKIARRMMDFWRQGRNIYLGGLIRIALAGLFLFYAPRAKLPLLVFIFGVLAFTGGMLIFILGLQKFKAIIAWWDSKPEIFLRFSSLLIFVFGILLLYSA